MDCRVKPGNDADFGGVHRAISQVVPSLESLMTTPIAASSSDPIGFLEVFSRPRSGAFGNQTIDLFDVDAARLLFSAFPFRRALGQETQKPQGSRKRVAIPFTSGSGAIAQTVQRGDHLRRVQVV